VAVRRQFEWFCFWGVTHVFDLDLVPLVPAYERRDCAPYKRANAEDDFIEPLPLPVGLVLEPWLLVRSNKSCTLECPLRRSVF
jgi:hypothetical protein